MRTVHVMLDVPDDIDSETREVARAKAHEAAVLALWQQGKFTNREAALELDLSYHDFVDLLAARGIPVVSGGDVNLDAIEEASTWLADDRP